MWQGCWAQHVVCVNGHRVAMCCDMLGVVGSNLKMVKFELTTPNILQHVATRWPMHATFCTQQCYDMLRWPVVTVLPGLNVRLYVCYVD